MNWALLMIKLVWGKISGTLRESVVNFVKDLDEKAKATENDWDDVLVGILKSLLGI